MDAALVPIKCSLIEKYPFLLRERERERSPARGFHGAMLICNAVFTDRKRAATREKINLPAKLGTPISLLRPCACISPGFAAYAIGKVISFDCIAAEAETRFSITDEIATLPRDYPRSLDARLHSGVHAWYSSQLRAHQTP